MEATLEAVKRSTKGKNEARRLRAQGRIPGTIYGNQKTGETGKSFPVAVDPKPLLRILHSDSGMNTLITIKIDGEGESRVLVKDLQLDPVTSNVLHADFYRVNMDRRITVTVQIVIKGEAKGVKLEGGVLDVVHREIELECLPAEIPDAIEIDVRDLNLGDAIHVRDVATNANWTPRDPDLMLVHVITPRAIEEPVAAEAAAVAAPAGAAEPEVIKKGKTEKEGEEAAAKEGGKKEAKESGKKEK